MKLYINRAHLRAKNMPSYRSTIVRDIPTTAIFVTRFGFYKRELESKIRKK